MSKQPKANQPKLKNNKTLSIDVGGQGVKGRVFDASGTPLTDRVRLKTPRPADPASIQTVIMSIAEQQRPFDRIAIGFPGVVRNGVIHSAPNLDGSWEGTKLEELVAAACNTPVRVVNDADMQGFGAIASRGVELVITLGTGMGAALFLNGQLLPNLELGHHPFEKGQTYEERLGQAALDRAGEAKWNRRLQRAIELLHRIYNVDHLYVGGGNARLVQFPLPERTTVVDNATAFLGGLRIWT